MARVKAVKSSLIKGLDMLIDQRLMKASEAQQACVLDKTLREHELYVANPLFIRWKDGRLQYGLGGSEVFQAIVRSRIGDYVFDPDSGYHSPLDESAKQLLERYDSDIVWESACSLNLNHSYSTALYLFITYTNDTLGGMDESKKRFMTKFFGKGDDYREVMKMIEKVHSDSIGNSRGYWNLSEDARKGKFTIPISFTVPAEDYVKKFYFRSNSPSSEDVFISLCTLVNLCPNGAFVNAAFPNGYEQRHLFGI